MDPILFRCPFLEDGAPNSLQRIDRTNSDTYTLMLVKTLPQDANVTSFTHNSSFITGQSPQTTLLRDAMSEPQLPSQMMQLLSDANKRPANKQTCPLALNPLDQVLFGQHSAARTQ